MTAPHRNPEPYEFLRWPFCKTILGHPMESTIYYEDTERGWVEVDIPF